MSTPLTVAEYAREVAAQAPLLTTEQRARLAALLRPTGGGAREAA